MSHEKYKLVKQINQIHGTQLDSEIREKQKKHYRFNPQIITEGYNFAKSGLTVWRSFFPITAYRPEQYGHPIPLLRLYTHD